MSNSYWPRKGFDDSVGRNPQPSHFELPTYSKWVHVANRLYQVMIENGEDDAAEISLKVQVSWKCWRGSLTQMRSSRKTGVRKPCHWLTVRTSQTSPIITLPQCTRINWCRHCECTASTRGESPFKGTPYSSTRIATSSGVTGISSVRSAVLRISTACISFICCQSQVKIHVFPGNRTHYLGVASTIL